MNEEERIKFSELSNFFPKQQKALEATKSFKYVLYGGSVGSGKSRWLRWASLYWLIRLYGKYNIPGIRAGLFCEDYPSLNDRQLSKIRFEFPDWLGTYNESRHEFTLSAEYGGGVLAFRNLDDASKYLSVEFAVIAIDEINRNTKTVFDMLRSRLRWPGITQTRFMGACNPLGEAWVKNMWVKRLFSPDEKEQDEFMYIPALPNDNPHLPQEYFQSLESLPEVQRNAYLKGDWDAFTDTMDEKGYMRLLTDIELRGAVVPEGIHSGYKILGVDPAAGGDNSAIILKSGNIQQVLFNQKLQNTMDLVGVTMELYQKHHADFIVYDKTGVGQGYGDRLKDLNYPCRGISFGEASDSDMFPRIKDQLYWDERKWLLSGGRLLKDDGWNEFETIKYKIKDGLVTIQPKEELFKQGLKSPNCVDAAVLTMAVKDATIKSTRLLARPREFYDKMEDIWQGGKRIESYE